MWNKYHENIMNIIRGIIFFFKFLFIKYTCENKLRIEKNLENSAKADDRYY